MTVRRFTLLTIFSVLIVANLLISPTLRAQTYTYTTFDVPGAGTNTGQGTNALGINDSGTAVGNYLDTTNRLHGFIRASSGALFIRYLSDRH